MADTNSSKKRLVVNFDALVRRDTMGSKQYLVVPMVLMTPGAWNGIMYTAEELATFPDAWNGRVVTVGHPEINEEFVSANRTDIQPVYEIGHIYNAYYNEGLKAEAWIDEDRLRQVSPRLHGLLDSSKPVDVSIGVFCEEFVARGEFNGNLYFSKAQHLRPDHLAFLPDGKGACSWDDGAGAPRVNETEPDTKWIPKVLQKVLEALNLMQSDSNDPAESVESTDTLSEPQTNKEPQMEQVDALIANEATQFAEGDREWLATLSEDQLAKLAPIVSEAQPMEPNEPVEEPVDPEVVVNESDAAIGPEEAPVVNEVEPPAAVDHTELLAELKVFISEAIDAKVDTLKGTLEQTKVLDRLVANKDCTISKETLELMPVDDLERLEQSLQTPNYAGRGGLKASKSDVPQMPEMYPTK